MTLQFEGDPRKLLTGPALTYNPRNHSKDFMVVQEPETFNYLRMLISAVTYTAQLTLIYRPRGKDVNSCTAPAPSHRKG